MEQNWINTNHSLPHSGQEVLIYCWDDECKIHQINLVWYFRRGDVMDCLPDEDEVIAPLDGFYFYESDRWKRYADVTHWTGLPLPPNKEIGIWGGIDQGTDKVITPKSTEDHKVQAKRKWLILGMPYMGKRKLAKLVELPDAQKYIDFHNSIINRCTEIEPNMLVLGNAVPYDIPALAFMAGVGVKFAEKAVNTLIAARFMRVACSDNLYILSVESDFGFCYVGDEVCRYE